MCTILAKKIILKNFGKNCTRRVYSLKFIGYNDDITSNPSKEKQDEN